MRAVAVLATLLVTAASGVGVARAVEGAVWVFLYADRESSTVAYTPSQATSREAIVATVGRAGQGDYTVRLANAAAVGVPVVTAVGGDGAHCQVASFSRGNADETVRVGCFAGATPADSEFTLSFVSSTPPDSGATGAYGYVHDDKPTLASYVNPATRYNSTGGRVDVYRQDTRLWTARFFGQAFNNLAGNVQVSAVGARPARCGVVRWYPHSLGVDAQVRCDPLSGTFTPQWTLVYTHDRSIVGGSTGFFGYLQADQPTADFYRPSVPRNRAPNGLTHTITRGAQGRYQAQVYGPLKEPVDAHVTVNGDTDDHCTLVGLTITPSTQPAARVDINCYTTGGAPTDAVFSLNYYAP